MNEPIERFSTVVIENVEPAIDCGRYPVTRVAGQELEVAADIFKDGHDVLAAVLKWRPIGQPQWFETRMSEQINDRWIGICSFSRTGTYEYTIEAWSDEFRSWQAEYHKKFQGGLTDLVTEIEEGARMVERVSSSAGKKGDRERLVAFAEQIRKGD